MGLEKELAELREIANFHGSPAPDITIIKFYTWVPRRLTDDTLAAVDGFNIAFKKSGTIGKGPVYEGMIPVNSLRNIDLAYGTATLRTAELIPVVPIPFEEVPEFANEADENALIAHVLSMNPPQPEPVQAAILDSWGTLTYTGSTTVAFTSGTWTISS